MNKKEQKEFIAGSLATSTAISSRLLGSSSNDRSRPLAMKFHQTWRHPDCAVERWCQQQKSSSTEFTTIRHCRNTEGPFFHEFLTIPLLDGAICRLERMGEGSHANAIRQIGCMSHDIIQWFSASSYESDPIFKEPFEFIAEVTFPQTFDLLDILAICHTIHHSPRCSAYTLQRYNCYFLCLTVMNILARRVACWENVIDPQAIWSNIVGTAIDQLDQSSCDEPDEAVGLGICALVDPDHPDPRRFILDRLQTDISAAGPHEWRCAASATLWAEKWEQASKQGLERVVKAGVNEALSSEDSCAARMRDILEFDGDQNDEKALRDRGIEPEYAESIFAQYIRETAGEWGAVGKSTETRYELQKMEHEPSVGRRIEARARSFFLCICVATMGTKFTRMLNGEVNHNDRAAISLMRNNFRAMYSTFRAVSLVVDDSRLDKMIAERLKESAILCVHHALQREQRSSEPSLTLASLHILLDKDVWGRSLLNCVTARINKVIQGLRDSQVRLSSRRLRMAKTERHGLEISVEQFQEHIHDRIHAHATRVERYGLASSELIGIDMGIAMEEVWEGLPIGYGGIFRRTDE